MRKKKQCASLFSEARHAVGDDRNISMDLKHMISKETIQESTETKGEKNKEVNRLLLQTKVCGVFVISSILVASSV